jgi:hypothetical protein
VKVVSRRLRRSLLTGTVVLAAVLGEGHVGLAHADSALARDGSENYFDGTGENLSEARNAAMTACKRQGGKGCHVVYNSTPHTGGFGAAVANNTTVFYASGFDNSDSAFDSANANCREKTRSGADCELLAQWEDSNYVERAQRPVIVQNSSQSRSQSTTDWSPPRDTRTWHYEDSTGNVGDATDWNGNDNNLVYR